MLIDITSMNTSANQTFNSNIQHFISKDGTRIGYRTVGHGPAIVLVQGTMNIGYNFRDLALELSDTFTVIVLDRRGRGLSGTEVTDYCLAREVEDIHALLLETGAEFIFGLSSGALITLQSALQIPTICKIVVYEPPLLTKDLLPEKWIDQTNAALDRSDITGALIAGMKAGQFGPPWMLALPNWLLKVMFNAQPAPKEEVHSELEGASMRDLATTLRNDFSIVKELAGSHKDYQRLTIPTLLLGGSETNQAYLQNALKELGKVIPNSTSVKIMGLDHSGPLNRDQMGKPDPSQVAAEIRKFILFP